jgi:hypothetical protein
MQLLLIFIHVNILLHTQFEARTLASDDWHTQLDKFFLDRRLKEPDFELIKPSTSQEYKYRHTGVTNLQLTEGNMP